MFQSRRNHKRKWNTGSFSRVLLALSLMVPGTNLLSQEGGGLESLYRKPDELIPREEMVPIFQALESPTPDCANLQPSIESLLDRYYAQFLTEKRTAYERRTAPELTDGFDANQLRLLAMERARMVGPRHFQGNSPYLFSLHFQRGRCQDESGDVASALVSYMEAFRFTSFEPPGSGESEPVSLETKEAIYQQMKRGFAGEGRIPQEQDQAVAAAAERFNPIYSRYLTVQVELEEARREIVTREALLARGQVADVAGAQNDVIRLEGELQSLEGELESIRTGVFQTYLLRKNRIDGELAYRSAKILFRQEITEAELALYRSRLSDFQAGGAGMRIPDPRTKTDGYRSYLELAHRLDPENPEYISLLATEYRKARQTERAIQMEETFLGKAKAANPPPDNPVLARHYYDLGHLYQDTGNHLRAASALEEHLRLLEENPGLASPEELTEHRYRLAVLHYKNTGRVERTRELLLPVLEGMNGTNPANLSEKDRLEFHVRRYEIYRYLAGVSRRFRKTREEILNLEQATSEFEALEEEHTKILMGLEDARTRVNTIKAGLLSREDPEVQRQYYTIQRLELPGLENRERDLRIRLESLHHPALLERRAFLLARDRRYGASMELYRSVLRSGDSAEKTRSRSNLVLLERSWKSGQIPTLEAPDQFERY